MRRGGGWREERGETIVRLSVQLHHYTSTGTGDTKILFHLPPILLVDCFILQIFALCYFSRRFHDGIHGMLHADCACARWFPRSRPCSRLRSRPKQTVAKTKRSGLCGEHIFCSRICSACVWTLKHVLRERFVLHMILTCEHASCLRSSL